MKEALIIYSLITTAYIGYSIFQRSRVKKIKYGGLFAFDDGDIKKTIKLMEELNKSYSELMKSLNSNHTKPIER